MAFIKSNLSIAGILLLAFSLNLTSIWCTDYSEEDI